jgi:hypothetical protein
MADSEQFPIGSRVRDTRGPSYYGWGDVGTVVSVRDEFWRVIVWDRPERLKDGMLVRHLTAE